MSDELYALRGKQGGFSRIFTSRDELEEYVVANGIAGAEVGLVSFIPLCSIRAKIEIPWEEGIGSLQSRFQQPGASEDDAAASDSAVRTEIPTESPAPRGNKKRKS